MVCASGTGVCESTNNLIGVRRKEMWSLYINCCEDVDVFY